MLVLSNQRLGPAAELLVSRPIAGALVRAVADAARPVATAYWERELVRWLDEQALRIHTTTERELVIDVSEIAFTPHHFDQQRQFLIQAIERARAASEHAAVLVHWLDMIKAHPRDSILVGRRWRWQPTV